MGDLALGNIGNRDGMVSGVYFWVCGGQVCNCGVTGFPDVFISAREPGIIDSEDDFSSSCSFFFLSFTFAMAVIRHYARWRFRWFWGYT